MDDTSPYAVLVDGLRKTLDFYLEQRAQLRQPTPGHRRLRPPMDELRNALREQFPEWFGVAAEAAEQNGRDERWLRHRSSDDRWIMHVHVLELLDSVKGQSDTSELAPFVFLVAVESHYDDPRDPAGIRARL